MPWRHDRGYCTVRETGCHDLDPGFLQELDDTLGRGGSGDIDIADPLPQERVPHRTADKPCLDVSCRKCRQHRASCRLDHPRLWNNSVLLREFRHWPDFGSICPGTM